MRATDFHQQPHARARGRVGEDAAEGWLRGQGYQVVARNVSYPAGEIDLVARDGDTLCFLEIKARSGRAYGPAIAAVSAQKQRRVARAAALYLAYHPTPDPCRFDVLALDLVDGVWHFTLVKNAFEVPG